ncbi:CHAT domain-containing protein [Stenotrophomonas sp. WHRI 8082]|uniref:CHAT domain-containing protein n=1 Tax=Stenotrophomonas sp. WHRI 8082 TaxID=3162571 RepID=UPI0032EEA88A
MTTSTTTPSRVMGFDPAAIYRGSAERATLLIGVDTDPAVGRTTAHILMCESPEGKPAFPRVVVIAPPAAAWAKNDDEIIALISQGGSELRGSPLSREEVSIIRKRVTIVRCEDVNAASLVAQVVRSDGDFILVPMAEIYRDARVVAGAPHGRATALLAEDIWVPNVSAWLPDCIDHVHTNESAIMFSIPGLLVMREANKAAIEAIYDLTVASFGSKEEVQQNTFVVENMQQWAALAEMGRAREALAQIEASDLSAGLKRQLRIQVLFRGKERERAAEEIRALLVSGVKVPSENGLRFGWMAQEGGDPESAKTLIKQSVVEVNEESHLARALGSCTGLDDSELEVLVYERLRGLYPESEALTDYRARLLLRWSREVSGDRISRVIRHITLVGYDALIADSLRDLSTKGVKALAEVSEPWSAEQRDFARLCGAHRLLVLNEAGNAIALAIQTSLDGESARRINWILIAALRRVLLERKEVQEAGFYKEVFQRLRDYVATHPDDPELREYFRGLFTVETSGNWGLALLVTQTMELATRAVAAIIDPPMVKVASPQEFSAFMQRADHWMGQARAIDVSSTALPDAVIGADDPAELLEAMSRAVDYLVETWEPDKAANVENMAFVGVMLARKVPDTLSDMNMLRLIASRRAMDGKVQRSRDLAEQILELAGSSKIRGRLAWGAYADLYQRSRHPVDALIGLSSAFAIDVPVDAPTLWWETYTLFRSVRDIGLFPFAGDLLVPLKRLQRMVADNPAGRARMQSLELGLRLMDSQRYTPAMLEQMVQDTANHYVSVAGMNEELIPALALLVQSMGLFEGVGGVIPKHVQEIKVAAMEHVTAADRAYLDAISAAHPTIEDAVLLHNRVEVARHADDAPGDLLAAELAARRILSESALSAEDAATAIELLADRELDPVAIERVLDVSWPSRYLHEIRPEAGAAMMMGLDIDGELTVLTSTEQGDTVARPAREAGSFVDALATWSENYPLRYGKIEREEGNNEIFVSMTPLAIPLPETAKLVVVGEPALLQIPLNLMVKGDGFWGQHHAIGYVPSLTWLHSTRTRPRITHARRVAWISDPGEVVDNSALVAVIQRTDTAFQQYGFRVDTNGSLPEDLVDAQIAVIAAHGSVGTDGRFLHRVTDEKELVISPRALTQALAGTELVILFICSGGRVDRHPHSNTTIGLPKLLLMAGSRVVIASPWPITPIISGYWLETFMAEWERDETALDSTFVANAAVDMKFGYVPQYAMAMTAYGDVMLKRSAAAPPEL